MDDVDRPLAERGRRDAPAAGRWLRSSGHPLDHVICSPAQRTRETWELVSHELASAPQVDFDERVYAATGSELLEVIQEAPDRARTLLLVGHNPGVQDLTLFLAGSAADDALTRAQEKFPTSAIAVLVLDDPWPALLPGRARLAEFVVPRGGARKRK